MLVKAIMAQVTSDRDYEKVLKKRMYIFYAYIILGIITDILAFKFSTGDTAYLSSFLSGVYSGTGTGLLVCGVIMLIRTKKILKDEVKLKEKRLQEQDERNRTIMQKSMYTAALILIFLVYLALLISGIFNLVVFWTLWIIAVVYMVIFVLLSFYYNKKM